MGGVGARTGVSVATLCEEVGASWRSEMEKISPTAKRKQQAKRRREMLAFMFIGGGRWYPEKSFAGRKV
jgi:hypothetical protein